MPSRKPGLGFPRIHPGHDRERRLVRAFMVDLERSWAKAQPRPGVVVVVTAVTDVTVAGPTFIIHKRRFTASYIYNRPTLNSEGRMN